MGTRILEKMAVVPCMVIKALFSFHFGLSFFFPLFFTNDHLSLSFALLFLSSFHCMEKQQYPPPRSSLVDMTYSVGTHPLYDTPPLCRSSPITSSNITSLSSSQSQPNSNDHIKESGLCSVFDKLKMEDRRYKYNNY